MTYICRSRDRQGDTMEILVVTQLNIQLIFTCFQYRQVCLAAHQHALLDLRYVLTCLHTYTRARVHRMSGPTDLLTYYWEQGFQDALHWNVAPAAPDTIADPRLHLLPLTLALSKKINKISTQEGGVLCPSVTVLV